MVINNIREDCRPLGTSHNFFRAPTCPIFPIFSYKNRNSYIVLFLRNLSYISYFSGPIDQNKIFASQKMLNTYLEMPFCNHLKDRNTKKFSPRFARRKGHIEYFIWRAAAEKWHIFFMKSISKLGLMRSKTLKNKICPIFTVFCIEFVL